MFIHIFCVWLKQLFTNILEYGLLQPEMEILEGRQEYTFYESTNNTLTPDKMLSDIYEVIEIEIYRKDIENMAH